MSMTGSSEKSPGQSRFDEESVTLLNQRTPAGRAFSSANKKFQLALQWCPDCHREQYPPAVVCGSCLGSKIRFRVSTGKGQLLARSHLSHSLLPCFQKRIAETPWLMGSIKLHSGPVVLAHLGDRTLRAHDNVHVFTYGQDKTSAVLIAVSAQEQIPTLDAQRSAVSRLFLDTGVNPEKD